MRPFFLFLPAFFVFCSSPASAQWKTEQFSPTLLNHTQLQDLQGRTTRVAVGSPAKLVAFVFLSPECPLCRNYTVTLNRLSKVFNREGVRFYGIISGKGYPASEVGDFKKAYHIAFPVLIDSSQQLTRYLGVTVTPEVKLIDSRGELIYSGEIDNWAVSLGQQRAVITENYLQDAINEDLGGRPVKKPRTQPVGCLINDL